MNNSFFKKIFFSIVTGIVLVPLVGCHKKEVSDSILKIATYNVSINASKNTDKQMSLLEKNDIDIVGIQEIEEGVRGADGTIVTRATDFSKGNYDYFFFGQSTVKGVGGAYGNMILSKHQMGETEIIPLYSIEGAKYEYSEIINKIYGEYNPTDPQSIKDMEFLWGKEGIMWNQRGGVEQRSISHAVINYKGKKISFYTTHLSFELSEVREKQFKDIKKILDKDMNEYKIIVGDFNSDQSTKDFDIFKNSYKIANGHEGIWLDTYREDDDSNMKIKMIDNIIVSNNIDIKDVKMIDSNLSDHNPLIARLELK